MLCRCIQTSPQNRNTDPGLKLLQNSLVSIFFLKEFGKCIFLQKLHPPMMICSCLRFFKKILSLTPTYAMQKSRRKCWYPKTPLESRDHSPRLLEETPFLRLFLNKTENSCFPNHVQIHQKNVFVGLKWEYVDGTAKANERRRMPSFIFGNIPLDVGKLSECQRMFVRRQRLCDDLFTRICHVWTLENFLKTHLTNTPNLLMNVRSDLVYMYTALQNSESFFYTFCIFFLESTSNKLLNKKKKESISQFYFKVQIFEVFRNSFVFWEIAKWTDQRRRMRFFVKERIFQTFSGKKLKQGSFATV